MRKIFIAIAVSASMALSSCEVLNKLPATMGNLGGLSEAEAAQGIKAALDQGIGKSVLQLNTADGFFKDALYKILLPPDAQKLVNTLRTLGLGNLVDKAILQINRGAEDAAGYAKPIFVDAIKSMTLQDAIGLVKNGDTSATHFFRVKTTDKLVAAFKPMIASSLQKVDATKYYDDLITKYNNFPTTRKKINPDLAAYVTDRATYALFDLIAKEEVNIRSNIAARSSAILQKVFGTKW